VQSRSPEVIALSLQRQGEPPHAPRPGAFAPVIEPIPELPADTRVFYDFDRAQQRSLTLAVREAGLYDVTTEGLLATACDLRTPTVARIAADSGGGRGRNCLLQAYRRPGRALLTVRTEGQSRGRAAVVMTRRPPAQGEQVATDGGAFFRAAAGELVQQRLVVRRGSGKKVDPDQAYQVRLETTAQG